VHGLGDLMRVLEQNNSIKGLVERVGLQEIGLGCCSITFTHCYSYMKKQIVRYCRNHDTNEICLHSPHPMHYSLC
jgi:hypothetical protein